MIKSLFHIKDFVLSRVGADAVGGVPERHGLFSFRFLSLCETQKYLGNPCSNRLAAVNIERFWGDFGFSFSVLDLSYSG